jgi:hypothetical protein
MQTPECPERSCEGSISQWRPSNGARDVALELRLQAARAGGDELAPRLRIEVEQRARLQERRAVHLAGADEPDLLVAGDEELDGAVRDLLVVVEEREHRGHRDAVVGADAAHAGGEAAVLDLERDLPLLLEVADGDDIEVALEAERDKNLPA